MNFFKSVFSDDSDPPQPESGSDNTPLYKDTDPEPSSTEPQSTTGDSGGGDRWNFGGLIKTLTARSESIIETYRRDLQEFGTGLKKEIEVAQGSLGTVGHVIDEFGNTVVKGTAHIISQGKDAILAVDLDSDSDSSSSNLKRGKSLDSKRYSRFEAQVRAIQGDDSTYTEEPEDLSDFNEWKSEFSLDGKSEEMEGFFRENYAMENVFRRVVPNTVDHETFWYRYYYKVYKLKKAEDVRARLVRRISKEEEDLSWDVDDDDENDEEEVYEADAEPDVMVNKVGGGENARKQIDGNEEGTKRLNVEEVKHSGKEESKAEKRDNLLQSEEIGRKLDKSVEESEGEKSEVVEKGSKLQVDNAGSKNDSAAESDEKVITERESGDGKSSAKSNESTVVDSQHKASEEEEDLGWDEIEDLSGIDEKKVTQSGSTSKADLRKRLNAAEEEEDLSWDIEDDDEPAKA